MFINNHSTSSLPYRAICLVLTSSARIRSASKVRHGIYPCTVVVSIFCALNARLVAGEHNAWGVSCTHYGLIPKLRQTRIIQHRVQWIAFPVLEDHCNDSIGGLHAALVINERVDGLMHALGAFSMLNSDAETTGL